MKEEELVDLELYDLFKYLETKNAGEVLIIRATFEKAKDTMLASANKFLELLTSKDGIDNFEDNLTMFTQSFAQALYIDKKLELCKRFSDELTPECFKSKE